MAYQMTRKSRRRLDQAIRRFNRTISNLEKSFAEDGRDAILPKKRKLADVVASISNYNELKRELRSLARLKQGKPSKIVDFGNIKTIKYNIDEIKLNLRRSNTLRKEYADMIGYERKGYTADTENMRERGMPDLSRMMKKTFGKYMENLAKEATYAGQDARLQRLVDNYKKSIQENFSKSQAKQLNALVNRFDATTFATLYVSGDIPDIEFNYSNDERGNKYRRIISTLESLL